MTARQVELEPGVTVLVRGWLHGNVVCMPGAVIDAGYHTGVAEVRAAAASVAEILLTHVHSDHAGGVAALVAATGARVHAHADAADLVERWDERGLWLGATGQHMPRFRVDAPLADAVEAGGRRFTVIGTPGHAKGGVAFLSEDGMLVTGDALWEDGFGILNPWIDGPGVYARAGEALDRLAALDGVRVVVPGHGAPFTDLDGAIARARSRLAYLEARPDRLRRKLLRDYLAFHALAHPRASAVELRATVEVSARAYAPLPGDTTEVDLDALVLAVRATSRDDGLRGTPRPW